jgi:death on curing protein
MIPLEQVLEIHRILIDKYGGLNGIRDSSVLDSALARPFQTFFGEDLYPTITGKCAALVESIVKNHPFLDGNKRTGYTVMELLLWENNMEIRASEDEKYNFVIAVAEGRLDYEAIKTWIEQHV